MVIKCTRCGAETKPTAKRRPPGWKVLGEEDICRKCMKRDFVLRAVTMPLAGPVEGGDWKKLRAVLKTQWAASTASSNWLVSKLFAADVHRTPDMAKLPDPPKTYFYPEAREAFPSIPSNSYCSIDHAVTGKYRRKRWDVLWRNAESIPNYKYPIPYPVKNKTWTPFYGERKTMLVSLRIGDQRWTLRLRGGKEFKRQMVSFRQLVDGSAIKGEMAIYRKRANASDHRPSDSTRDATGRKQYNRIMIKLVGYYPKAIRPSGDEVLYAYTETDRLLAAYAEPGRDGDPVFIRNCDQLPRWVMEHERKLQRWREDRPPKRRSKNKFQGRIDAAVAKRRNRFASLTHEVAAHLVGYAVHHRYGKIVYDDRDKLYCHSFVWYELVQKISEKCDAASIVFEHIVEAKPDNGDDAIEQDTDNKQEVTV